MQPLRDLSPGAPAQPATKRQPFGGPRPPRREPDLQRHASFELPIQRAQAKGRACDVPGCWRLAEDFGHLCMTCRNKERRHGHPEAGSLPRKYVGAWVVQASRYIAQVSKLDPDHPARRQLELARHWMRQEFNRAEGFESVAWKPKQSFETRWRRHAATLERHDIGVDRVLALVTAFYIARDLLPAMCAASDKHELVQMARLVLGSVSHPYPSWHSNDGTSEVLGLRYPVWLGQRLRRGVGHCCGLMAFALLGRASSGMPAPSDQRPVSCAAARGGAIRKNFRPLPDQDDD